MMRAAGWTPPRGWTRITSIDAHTAGEPFRVITGGVPEIPGATMLERRRWARSRLDGIRRMLMWEPRGHADMYGCLVTPPAAPGSDLGVLFMHNEGFSTMCGHGIIALATVALETGMVGGGVAGSGTRRLAIDTPAGTVRAAAEVKAGRVVSVKFLNVPSFVSLLDATVPVPGMGRVRYDLAFGGAFYAFVEAREVGMACEPASFRGLMEAGIAVKQAVMEKGRPVVHPLEEDLGFLYGVIFTGPAAGEGAHSRHVCVFADGEVDRSPTGTGVSARLAILHARGTLRPGQVITVESILGSSFSARVADLTTCGDHPAVVPEVEGRAHITGRHEFLVDPDDALGGGFLLR